MIAHPFHHLFLPPIQNPLHLLHSYPVVEQLLSPIACPCCHSLPVLILITPIYISFCLCMHGCAQSFSVLFFGSRSGMQREQIWASSFSSSCGFSDHHGSLEVTLLFHIFAIFAARLFQHGIIQWSLPIIPPASRSILYHLFPLFPIFFCPFPLQLRLHHSLTQCLKGFLIAFNP